MPLTPKDVACSCGHVTTLANKKLLCIKCGNYVFYDENEKKSYKRHKLYVALVIAMALGLFAFFFVEIMLRPLLFLLEK